jgi:hypothetical protein
MKHELQKIQNLARRKKHYIWLAGLLVGFLLGAFVAFQFTFLSHVLPHGGF